MSIPTDAIIERIKLKSSAKKWRILAIILFISLLIALSGAGGKAGALKFQDHIARIKLEGIIINDPEMLKRIKAIRENKKVRAVIVAVDSPGGTAVGGEEIYNSLVKLAAQKPVVAVMNGLAASAAYMVSLPAERIFAHHSTLTGSIGVLVEIPNLKDLAGKVGVKMDVIRTGTQKGEPSLFTDMTPETRQILQRTADDFQNYFIHIVAKHRNIPQDVVRTIADGRIFSGAQAVQNRLVDQIGGEEDALSWLTTEKKLDKNLQIQDYSLEPEIPKIQQFLKGIVGNSLIPNAFSVKGLLSVWPYAHNN